MSALSDTELAGMGLKTPPPEPTRFAKESRSFAAGLLLLLALFGLAVVGCRALPNPWETRTVQTTDPRRYEEFAHQWPKVLPGQIPTHATNVKFRYYGSLSFRSYETITLGVTLPRNEVEAILRTLRSTATKLDGSQGIWVDTLAGVDIGTQIDLGHAETFNSRASKDLYSSNYSLVAIDERTNRVVWLIHQDSG
jgi:hypothetical protein